MIQRLEFSESEVKYILGERYVHRMKDILQCAEKVDENQEEIDIEPNKKKTDEEEKKEDSELKQPSIFDF